MKIIVNHPVKNGNISGHTHALETTGQNGGDDSKIEISFTNDESSGVNFEKTNNGYKLIYYGDDEGKSLAHTLRVFADHLGKLYDGPAYVEIDIKK